MTISDDVYYKLSVVTSQLGRERTQNDNLRNDYQNLWERYEGVARNYYAALHDNRTLTKEYEDLCKRHEIMARDYYDLKRKHEQLLETIHD